MTENTTETVEITAEELAALRSTREISPVKPQDHKPADDEVKQFTYAGVTFDIPVKVARSARFFRDLESGSMSAAVERMLGEGGYDKLLDAIEAEYGTDDMEKVGEFVGKALESVSAKN